MSLKELDTRWGQINDDYRRRHRTWVWTHMPTMVDAQWTQYEQWVAGFSMMRDAKNLKHAKLRDQRVERTMRSLRIARNLPAELPPTVTKMGVGDRIPEHAKDEMRYLVSKHKRQRFAMGLSITDATGTYGVGKRTFTKLALEAGRVKPGRATRRK